MCSKQQLCPLYGRTLIRAHDRQAILVCPINKENVDAEMFNANVLCYDQLGHLGLRAHSTADS